MVTSGMSVCTSIAGLVLMVYAIANSYPGSGSHIDLNNSTSTTHATVGAKLPGAGYSAFEIALGISVYYGARTLLILTALLFTVVRDLSSEDRRVGYQEF